MSKITELKAQAYDAIGQIEIWRIRLADTNQQIVQEVQNGTGTVAEPTGDKPGAGEEPEEAE